MIFNKKEKNKKKYSDMMIKPFFMLSIYSLDLFRPSEIREIMV